MERENRNKKRNKWLLVSPSKEGCELVAAPSDPRTFCFLPISLATPAMNYISTFLSIRALVNATTKTSLSFSFLLCCFKTDIKKNKNLQMTSKSVYSEMLSASPNNPKKHNWRRNNLASTKRHERLPVTNRAVSRVPKRLLLHMLRKRNTCLAPRKTNEIWTIFLALAPEKVLLLQSIRDWTAHQLLFTLVQKHST